MKKLTGIVIKADGTVPFDKDVDPAVKHAAIDWMQANGHDFENVPGTPHLKIKNWATEKLKHQSKG
jgi:hypothetical protein